jgi:hypothetical protein
MPFRSNMTEGWRSGNGTWADDDAGEFSLVSLKAAARRRKDSFMYTFGGSLTSTPGPAKTSQRRARYDLLSTYRESLNRVVQRIEFYDIILPAYLG